MYKHYLKAKLFLKRNFQQLIALCFVSYLSIHNNDPRVEMMSILRNDNY